MSLYIVPFVTAADSESRRCVLCYELISADAEVTTSEKATLNKYCNEWAEVDSRVCKDAPYTEFRNASQRLDLFAQRSDVPNFTVHKTCCNGIRIRLKKKQDQTRKLPTLIPSSVDDYVETVKDTEQGPSRIRRQSSDRYRQKVCFICEEARDENVSYNNGGVGRCETNSAKKRLEESKDAWLMESNSRYILAAERLNVLILGCNEDVFAADVYYHKQCYNKFTSVLRHGMKTDETDSEVPSQILSLFLRNVEMRIILDQDAFLLNELCKDCKEISAEFGLDDSPPELRFTYRVKETLIRHFEEKIIFSKVGKYVVVHSSAVNALTYTASTLKGHGLREENVIRCFANLVRRKLGKENDDIRSEVYVPPTVSEFMDDLDSLSPVKCIFNAISLSINAERTIEFDGYAKASDSAQGEKIAAISDCWERLLTNKRTATATALSLTLHRTTGSKEATQLLKKCGFGISYNDVRLITNSWAKEVSMSHKGMLPKGFQKKKSVHVTFDNSDGKQQTLIGDNTTHHTNGTIFQLINDSEQNSDALSDNDSLPDEENKEKKVNFGNFRIPIQRNRKPPPSFPEFSDKYKTSELLDVALQRDIAWVMVGCIGEKCNRDLNQFTGLLDPVGSWTAFMKDTSVVKTSKCLLEYLPVVPLPPKDNVIKWYLDMILQMAEDLEIEHIFVHADEAVISKIYMIMWLHEQKYDKLVPLLGGFHLLLVYLKILYKKYGCLGFDQWWVASGAIKEKSVKQAIEGKHYYRGIGLHKQSVNALLRCKIMKNLPVDNDIISLISKIRCNPNPETLQALLNHVPFKEYCTNLLVSKSGTQCQMMTHYVQDVSLLLALISAVREKTIELHVVAERVLLPKCFAFNHIHYARYLTAQHVNLQRIQIHKKEAWEDLVKDGFGGSLSGFPFSTIHGDLITECTINREVKVRGGPMRGGFSTSEDANDAFLKTSHVMAKIRSKLKERFAMLTSSVHKEITTGARKKHDGIVERLTRKLEENFDPFLNGPARHFMTGAQIDKSVISGLLSSDVAGERGFQKFVKERMMRTVDETDNGGNEDEINDDKRKVTFFDPIPKMKIKTGMEKEKKANKKLDTLKEDRQAFGVLVGKALTPTEALTYPLTSIPLSLADPDRSIRSQSTKSTLRNELISLSNAGKLNLETTSTKDWYVDGMLVVNSIEPQPTWKDFADVVLSYCIPKDKLSIRRLSIIFDSYDQSSIKQMTQMKRGYSANRVFITSLKQKMPQGQWFEAFLCNPENKIELIQAIVRRLTSDSVRSRLEFELLVTEETRTILITTDRVMELESSNHIEADTRLILEASKSPNDVVIRSADTDVLMLMCYAQIKLDIRQKWMMMIDKETYVDIEDIRSYFGDELCLILPAYHSITGCDTTSFPANVGKLRPFNKMMKHQSMNLLRNLGEDVNSFLDLSDALMFYHTVMYGGKPNETITDTRVRMFKSQKEKSSVNLIADEASVTQHLLRADLQTYIWKQCTFQNMTIPSIEGRGWYLKDDLILPMWFEGNQIPPSLVRSKKRCVKKGENTKSAKKKKFCENEKTFNESSRGDSSSSSSDSSSDTSSDWEAWEDGDFDSDSSDNDPDW